MDVAQIGVPQREDERNNREACDLSSGGRSAASNHRTGRRADDGRLAERRGTSSRRDARRRRLLRQDHARAALGRQTTALGAGPHGQPGTLHLRRAGRAPLRADEHARLVLGRGRGACVRPVDRALPRVSPLHPPTAVGHWSPAGGENERSDFISGPGTTNGIDRAHRHLAGSTLGIVGLGEIGRGIAQRAQAFEMRIVAVDPQPMQTVPGVETIWPTEQLHLLLAESDFVIIAAPHTPETAGLFRRERFAQMKRIGVLDQRRTRRNRQPGGSRPVRWQTKRSPAQGWMSLRPNRSPRITRCGGWKT